MHGITKRKTLLTLATVTAGLVSFGLYEHACVAEIEKKEVSTDAPKASEIPNFYSVHPYLLRGALPTPFGMEWLKNRGVKTIVDLREANTPPVIGERITASAMGFNYINLPVKDLPSGEQLDRFIKIVSKARDGAGPVFVHCNYGSDRTGFFIFFWRVAGEKWRWSLALVEMIERGFFIHKFSENKTKALADPQNW